MSEPTQPAAWRLSFAAEAGQLRGLRKSVRDGLTKRGVKLALLEQLLLTVDELASNAIEHGSSYRRLSLPLVLQLRVESRGIRLEFKDPEAPDEVVAQLQDALMRVRGHRPAPENERGRGLFLISDSLADIEVISAEGGGVWIRGLCTGKPK